MKNKIIDFINNSVYVLLPFLLSIIMILNLFFHNINYACRKEFLFPNFILLAVSLSIYIIFAIFIELKNKSELLIFYRYKHINNCTVFLFIILLYISYNIYFLTGWDAGLIINNAKAIARGRAIDGGWNTEYYSRYPNNRLLLLLEIVLFKIDNLFLGDIDNHFILIFVQCILYAAAGNILYRVILEHNQSKKYAWLGWLNFCILLAVSGWVTLPYTDGMALLFPILILRLYQKKENSNKDKLKFLYWILISLLSYWGYEMKPTVLIIFISIIIEELLFGIKNFNKDKLIKSFLVSSAIIICFTISHSAFNAAFNVLGIKTNEDLNVGALHFFMMGLKNDRDGVWDGSDVDLSWSIKDKKLLKQTQLQTIKQRLKDYGVVGFLRHTARKSLVIFNDGSFAWGVEGSFYKKVYNCPNIISRKLRDSFYNNGKTYPQLAMIEQAVWLMTLFICGFCFLIKKDKFNSVTIISIIGIIIFEYLFEARARYLMIYVPVFIILSIICLKNIANKIKN